MRSFEAMTLLDTLHFHVLVVPAVDFVLVRRRPEAFTTLDECISGYGDVLRKLDTLSRRRTRFLIDLRKAPGRNDPEFEAVVSAYRKKLFEKFMRAAALVRTASGKMQVVRHLREDQNDAEVFLDVADALRHLGLPEELRVLVDE